MMSTPEHHATFDGNFDKCYGTKTKFFFKERCFYFIFNFLLKKRQEGGNQCYVSFSEIASTSKGEKQVPGARGTPGCRRHAPGLTSAEP